MAFHFQTAFHLQSVCQPFKWLGCPFIRNISPLEQLRHPFIGNINPFKQLSYPFIRNIKRFERLGHPFVEDIGPFEWLDCLFVEDIRTLGCLDSSVIRIVASLWIFCWMTWETSCAIRSKTFTCLSGHLIQCFQDLFDFICTSLSALNSYFALTEITCKHKQSWSGFFFSDIADCELFCINDPLSDKKSKLKISYMISRIQIEQVEHPACKQNISKETWTLLLSACLNYKWNMFCQRLVLHTCKKYRESIKEAHVSFALFSFKWIVLCYLIIIIVIIVYWYPSRSLKACEWAICNPFRSHAFYPF